MPAKARRGAGVLGALGSRAWGAGDSQSASQLVSLRLARALVPPLPHPAIPLDPHDEYWNDLFIYEQHDYDPRWDYELRVDQLSDPLFQLAQRRLAVLAASEQTPFERAHVYPANLSSGPFSGPVGIYCSGTYNEAVILIDLDAHEGYEDQIMKTLEHEVVHAIQESEWDGNGEWAGEEQAETFVFE